MRITQKQIATWKRLGLVSPKDARHLYEIAHLDDISSTPPAELRKRVAGILKRIEEKQRERVLVAA